MPPGMREVRPIPLTGIAETSRLQSEGGGEAGDPDETAFAGP